MLKQIRIHNFKTYLNTVFSLGRVGLLLGENNAGKTNLCDAIRFLGRTATMPLQDAASGIVSDPGALKNVFLEEDALSLACDCSLPFDGEDTSFTYRLTLRYAGYGGPHAAPPTLLVDEEQLWAEAPSRGRMPLIEREGDVVKLTHETRFMEPNPESAIQTTAPKTETMLFRLYDLEHNPRANLFKTYLQNWHYYCFRPTALRSAKAKSIEQALAFDGSNLSSMIYQLKIGNERAYRRLVHQLQLLEPEVDIINFARPTPESVFMRFETRQGKQFDLTSISDGTLRFLALSYVLLELSPSVEEQPLSRLILIEEPENGIYVGHLRKLLELADGPDVASQFLFTSHSPYFIDLFEDRLDSVFVISREETHSSVRNPDPSRVAGLLEKFQLGELHFRELL